MSKMDTIYDRYVTEEKLKNGTKYEKLAAIIFKILNEDNNDVVLHDLKLSGEGKNAQHQIDVVIEKKEGPKRRVLIECKDYSETIGIDIVRNFYGVIHQIKPDKSIIITTKGYTQPAKDFANDENIQLVILKEFENQDWENKVQEIIVQIDYIMITTPKIKFLLNTNNLKEIKNKENIGESSVKRVDATDEYFYNARKERKMSFSEVISPIINSAERVEDKETKEVHIFKEEKYIYLNDDFIEIKGFEYSFFSYKTNTQNIINIGQKIALLLLKYINGDGFQKIFFDKDIEGWEFNEIGEVIKKTKF
ncbi:restriction endonuclease [Exiguobacterium sp. 9-2]|uniref:restriction endonuclease n=1 Tax=Exiguobacterium sp. 9-2 TaxID=3112419 RepID=UPI002E35812B|nr:restriction endonuclease [Exiguobacterium sp. 9-2]